MTYIATKGLFDSPTQENYEGLPVRYPKQKIDKNIFKNFFQKFGKYPGKQSTIKEVTQNRDRLNCDTPFFMQAFTYETD